MNQHIIKVMAWIADESIFSTQAMIDNDESATKVCRLYTLNDESTIHYIDCRVRLTTDIVIDYIVDVRDGVADERSVYIKEAQESIDIFFELSGDNPLDYKNEVKKIQKEYK